MGGMVNSLRCHRRERRIVTVMSRLYFNMEAVVQLVSTPDCGSGGREFESHLPPLCPCSLRGRSGGLKIRRILDRYQSGALKNKKRKYICLNIGDYSRGIRDCPFKAGTGVQIPYHRLMEG